MIPPGGEGEIKVTLRPKGTHTKISKNIVVYSNDPEQPRFTLTMKGTLLVDMIAQPPSVAIFDLANLSSAVHLLTEDLGRLEDGRLHLEGRAAGAELRGCSLTAEELAAGTPDPA